MPRRAFTLNLSDTKGLQRELQAHCTQIVTDVRHRMGPAGEALMVAANSEGNAPHGTGSMLGTAFVLDPVGGKKSAVVTSGYTHPLAPAVHEGFHGGIKRSKARTPTRGWFTRALFGFEAQFSTFIQGVLREVIG